VEEELLNAAHTNTLLLRQLFGQAEKWHLKLQADISELENKKLLDEIAQFEESEMEGNMKKDLGSLAQKPKLQPLNEGGSTALLQMEIQRLKEENDQLKDKVKTIEKTTTQALDEKNRLAADLDKAKRSGGAAPASGPTGDDVSLLSDRITALNADLKSAEEQYSQGATSTKEELANTKHYVLALQHELEVLNGEFDKKFADTTQFKNLKKMLEGKNTQLKELRTRLKRYEPEGEL